MSDEGRPPASAGLSFDDALTSSIGEFGRHQKKGMLREAQLHSTRSICPSLKSVSIQLSSPSTACSAGAWQPLLVAQRFVRPPHGATGSFDCCPKC